MIKFPEHKCGLFLTHNEHKDYYESVESWVSNFESWKEDFIDEEDMNLCFKTDECWSLQWYPETPIGSYVVRASTLEKLMDYVSTKETEWNA